MPTGLTIEARSRRADLSWAAADGAASYNIYWNATTEEIFVLSLDKKLVNTTETSYIHKNIPQTETYCYKVTAVNGAGESAPSSTAEAFVDVKFNYETVISSGTVGRYSAIAIGSDDTIHIVYYDSTNDDLEYAKKEAGAESWTFDTIDYSLGYTQNPDIALDSNGRVHVVYYDSSPPTGNAGPLYSTNASGDEGSWSTPALVDYDPAENDPYGFSPNIVVDSNNVIHVIYDAWTVSKYASKEVGDSSWNQRSLTSSSGTANDIAVDSEGNIHMAYEGSSGKLYYVKRDANNGSFASPYLLDSGLGNLAQNSISIVADASGYIHLAYEGDSPEILVYATNASDEVWTTTNIEEDDLGTSSSTIGIDSMGNAHIATFYSTIDVGNYFTNFVAETYSTTLVTDGWTIDWFDDLEDWGSSVSLAIDSQDRVHMSYYDEDSYNLRYAVEDY